MSRAPSELKQAIQGLGIGRKFKLRSPPPLSFQAPEARQIEVPRTEVPQAEPPQIEGASVGPAGFFRLAHAVFGDLQLRDLTGEEFRIFLWLSTRAWQFPDSDGRLRASVSYIQRGLGSSPASIERALRSLQAKKLLRLAVRDFKLGNLWEVSPKAVDRGPPGGARGRGEWHQIEVSQNGGAQSEAPQTDPAAPSSCVSSPRAMMEQPPQVEAEVRTSKNSQERQERTPRVRAVQVQDFGPKVLAYFDRPMPSRQRDREARAFAELRLTYSPEQIDRALAWVKSHGLPGSGQPVHSPLQFLAVGIASVPGMLEQPERRDHRPSVSTIDDGLDQAARAFAAAHPTPSDQQAAIDSYRLGAPGLRLGGRLVRELAIANWWRSQNIQPTSERDRSGRATLVSVV